MYLATFTCLRSFKPGDKPVTLASAGALMDGDQEVYSVPGRARIVLRRNMGFWTADGVLGRSRTIYRNFTVLEDARQFIRYTLNEGATGPRKYTVEIMRPIRRF